MFGDVFKKIMCSVMILHRCEIIAQKLMNDQWLSKQMY